MTTAEADVLATVKRLLARLDDADKDVVSSAQLSGLDDAYTTFKRMAEGGAVSNQTLNALAPLVRSWIDHGLFERVPHDVPANVETAARAVFTVFAATPLPSLAQIQALQKQLHQLFLFAVTCAPALPPLTAPAMHQLSGVLHFIGALNKVQLAPPPSAAGPPAVPDLGTAIFRCVAPACPKVFSRLFFLQLHARLHDPPGRSQSLRCCECTETFLRAVDLNKHLDAHAYRCAGCGETFPSRDVVEDHQLSDESGSCDGADIDEHTPPRMDYAIEDGEIVPEAFYRAVNAALPLQGILQTYASTAVASGHAGLTPAAPAPAPGAVAAKRPPGAPPTKPGQIKTGPGAPRPRAPSSTTPKPIGTLSAKPSTSTTAPPNASKQLAQKKPAPSKGPKTEPHASTSALPRATVIPATMMSVMSATPNAMDADLDAAAAAAMAAVAEAAAQLPAVGADDVGLGDDLIAQMMSSAAALAEAELWGDDGTYEGEGEGEWTEGADGVGYDENAWAEGGDGGEGGEEGEWEVAGGDAMDVDAEGEEDPTATAPV